MSKLSRIASMFTLTIILAAGPNGCRNHDMYSYPTTAAAPYASRGL